MTTVQWIATLWLIALPVYVFVYLAFGHRWTSLDPANPRDARLLEAGFEKRCIRPGCRRID